MAQIAYILLCHKEPREVILQARRLTRRGDVVAIHYDARAPKADWALLSEAAASLPGVTLVTTRVKCGWGEWSLVQATLNALRAALDAFPSASHFYMLSGDCMPTKPAGYIHDYLARHDCDWIESVDFHGSGWIKTGLREERLIYRHLFNERRAPRLFYGAMAAQERLGLARQVPEGLTMMIGSQWWCLRRGTVEAVFAFMARRPDIVRFFRTTWIPDETFFQTLVRHLVPSKEIESRTLTFLMFSDYGMPVTFYNDHYDLLTGQDCLFARKISPEATDLKRRLSERYDSDARDVRVTGEGRRRYEFLTTRGRIGQRFAPRFWERDTTVGRDRELLVIACKKWHVAKRLISRIGQHSNLPAIAYLFDEEATPLPDLGGIEASIAKRTRHRRALLRMLFEHYETDRLAICMDTANIDLLRDFYADRGQTRLLEVDCVFTDDYLAAHARRIGLAGQETPDEDVTELLPAVRNDVVLESDRLRAEGFPDHFRFRERGETRDNARALEAAFRIPAAGAEEIAEDHTLFAD